MTTIRFLAQELYRLTRKGGDWEKPWQNASLEERARREAELFQPRRDQEHYRNLLEAKKEKPAV